SKDALLLPTGRFIGQQVAPATVPGDSISPYIPRRFNVPPVTAATFGAVVESGERHYLLGSNHALAYNGRARAGTAFVAPATLDDPDGASVIASLSHLVELLPAAWPPLVNPSNPNTADCALAELAVPIPAATDV